MRPSAIESSRAKDSLRIWNEIWIPFVGDGSTWAMFSMHIATRGQSWQSLPFWPPAQHGMSLDIAGISVISTTAKRFAAAGVTSGAKTSPTITKTASKRPMSRRTSMAHHHMRLGTWEASLHHIVARWRRRSKVPEHERLTCAPRHSAGGVSSDELHEGLPPRRSENNNVVLLGCTALHTRRPHGHARNSQPDGGRPFFQQST